MGMKAKDVAEKISWPNGISGHGQTDDSVVLRGWEDEDNPAEKSLSILSKSKDVHVLESSHGSDGSTYALITIDGKTPAVICFDAENGSGLLCLTLDALSVTDPSLKITKMFKARLKQAEESSVKPQIMELSHVQFIQAIKPGVRVIANVQTEDAPLYQTATVDGINSQGHAELTFDDGDKAVYQAQQHSAGIVGLANATVVEEAMVYEELEALAITTLAAPVAKTPEVRLKEAQAKMKIRQALDKAHDMQAKWKGKRGDEAKAAREKAKELIGKAHAAMDKKGWASVPSAAHLQRVIKQHSGDSPAAKPAAKKAAPKAPAKAVDHDAEYDAIAAQLSEARKKLSAAKKAGKPTAALQKKVHALEVKSDEASDRAADAKNAASKPASLGRKPRPSRDNPGRSVGKNKPASKKAQDAENDAKIKEQVDAIWKEIKSKKLMGDKAKLTPEQAEEKRKLINKINRLSAKYSTYNKRGDGGGMMGRSGSVKK